MWTMKWFLPSRVTSTAVGLRRTLLALSKENPEPGFGEKSMIPQLDVAKAMPGFRLKCPIDNFSIRKLLRPEGHQISSV